MKRSKQAARRSGLQAGADRQTAELGRRMGRMLLDARRNSRQTQSQAAHRAGISQSAWSRLELGDVQAGLITWNRAASAVGARFDGYIRGGSAADQPRDAVHLRNQELIIRMARPGGWRSLPEEQIDRDARTSRAADVLLHRRVGEGAAEYALVEVWDWFDDVGAPIRAWDSRLAAVERYAVARMVADEPVPRISGCWVVRATKRNRQLLNEHRHFFRARFPGSAREWLSALTGPTTRMPTEPAIVWVSVDGTRLFPARLG